MSNTYPHSNTSTNTDIGRGTTLNTGRGANAHAGTSTSTDTNAGISTGTGTGTGTDINRTNKQKLLAQYIDHTLLKPTSTSSQIHNLCKEAQTYSFYSVCIPPCYVSQARQFLKAATGSALVGTVIGFPLGYQTITCKLYEAHKALQDGAQELDMVLSIANLKENQFHRVQKEIEQMVKEIHPTPLKVILETCLLTQKEKEQACIAAMEGGAHFVKTSTGFSTGGACIEDILQMRQILKGKAKIKASGGIRSYEQAKQFIEAGADRIGTSHSVSIIEALSKGRD